MKKALNENEMKNVIDDFDFGKNDITNITIDVSKIKDIIKKQRINNLGNISNLSKIDLHLEKSELVGMSKLDKMNFLLRPSNRSGMGRNRIIRKTQDKKKPKREISKDVYNLSQNQPRRFKDQSRDKPMQPDFNNFRTLRASDDNSSEESSDSNEFDSFDEEKEQQKINSWGIKKAHDQNIKRFKSKDFPQNKPKFEVKHLNDLNEKIKSFNTFQRESNNKTSKKSEIKELPKYKNSLLEKFGFSSSRKNKKNVNSIELPPKKESKINNNFVKEESGLRGKGLVVQSRGDFADDEEIKFEKLNIYKNSIYQDSINQHLKNSRSKKSFSSQKKSHISKKKHNVKVNVNNVSDEYSQNYKPNKSLTSAFNMFSPPLKFDKKNEYSKSFKVVNDFNPEELGLGLDENYKSKTLKEVQESKTYIINLNSKNVNMAIESDEEEEIEYSSFFSKDLN